MVLIQLRIHRIDLALTEGVIERLIDGGGRNAKARGGRAINDQRNGIAAELLIGGHIFKLGPLFQLGHEPRRPVV